ncbi:CASP8 and FADD-like apoptosis regulator [Anableps anableps]
MSPLEDLYLRINVVAEDLSIGDRKKAIYLCGSLVMDSSVAFVSETLRLKVDFEGEFIISVLWQLGRYDILKKVYKVGRNEIDKRIQTYGQVLPKFRVLMVTISDNLEMEDVEQIKFLLSRTLKITENVKTFLEVVIELEKLNLVSPEKVELVEDCLRHISRLDLVKKVTAYKMSAPTSERSLSVHLTAATSERSLSVHLTAATSERSLPPRQSGRATTQLEQYNFTANPRGVCVIIDSVGNDGGMLAKTFEALRFNILHHVMLGADEIFKTLNEISKHRESHNGDAFVCCIISRSIDNNLLGTDLYGRGLSVEMVRSLFLGDSCPVLANKPKLFFIQSYRVPKFDHLTREGNLEQDGYYCLPTYNNLPIEADILWSHCWTDESQLQQEQHHSVYLKAVTDALSKAQRRKMGLLDVQTKVNGAIYDHNKKHPEANYHCEVKSTLRKNLFLE